MKEDIIAANLSSLRSDIQALPDKIVENFPSPTPALPPSQFECWFISSAHTDADIAKALEVADLAFAEVEKM